MRTPNKSARRLLAGSAAASVVVVLLLAGCSMPTLDVLPSSHAVSGSTYPLALEVKDAPNLPIGARVKVDGAVIGEVTRVSTHNFVARVDMSIANRVQLPVGTTAQIRFTTPLGENYVALYRPQNPGSAVYHAHDVMPLQATSSAPSIEDAFAALSVLLNGGGLQELNTIVSELEHTLNGHTGQIRDLVKQLDTVVGRLNARRGDIDRTLVALNQLASTLKSRNDVIVKAMNTFPDAIQVVASQTAEISALMSHIDRLGRDAATVIKSSSASLTQDVTALTAPVQSLLRASSDFGATMNSLLTAAKNLTGAIPGDYANADINITLLFTDPIVPTGATR